MNSPLSRYFSRKLVIRVRPRPSQTPNPMNFQWLDLLGCFFFKGSYHKPLLPARKVPRVSKSCYLIRSSWCALIFSVSHYVITIHHFIYILRNISRKWRRSWIFPWIRARVLKCGRNLQNGKYAFNVIVTTTKERKRTLFPFKRLSNRNSKSHKSSAGQKGSRSLTWIPFEPESDIPISCRGLHQGPSSHLCYPLPGSPNDNQPTVVFKWSTRNTNASFHYCD